MLKINNDSKKYRTRESLSSAPKAEPIPVEKKVTFALETVGHYVKRAPQ